MPAQFDPANGADGWQVSNPPILQMAALRASLEIFEEIGLPAIRSKSVELLEYFDYLIRDIRGADFQVITPAEMTSRGAQVSMSVGSRGEALLAALRDNNVVCDARGSVIRVSFAPLYNGFTDVYRFARVLSQGLADILT
jgi:kynureninase